MRQPLAWVPSAFAASHAKQEASVMLGAILRCTICGIAAACLVANASPLWAIETTYGEDPVPNTQCYPGYINLGYGIDPIPAKTLCERWHAWRASRGLPPYIGIFPRNFEPAAGARAADRAADGKSTGVRSGSRRTGGPNRSERLP